VSLLNVATFSADYLGSTDTSHDTELQRICDRAEQIVKDWLRRPDLELQQYSEEKIDGYGEEFFNTKHKPIALITELVIDDDDIEINDDIFIYDEDGQVDVDFRISKGKQNIVITYWAGYVGDAVADPVLAAMTLPTLPKSIEEAMYAIATRLWKDSKLGEGNAGLSSRSNNQGGSANYIEKWLSPDLREALQKYKQWNL
jgi:hypothetical protein